MKDREDKKKGTGAGLAVGAATGGVAGGATAGALAGGVTGPVGAVIGAAVGAAIGAIAGRGAASGAESQDGDRSGTAGSAGGTSSGLQTVIGVFEDPAAAQRAVERLSQSGFDRDDIHVQHGQGGAGIGQGGDGNFFPNLFGVDASNGDSGQQHPHAMHVHTYDEAVRRGNAVVVVDADGETQADHASALMHELGAVDVDERSSQWRAQGWQPPQQGVAAGAGVSGGAAIGEQGDKLQVVQEELEVGKREVARGGVRVVQRLSQKPVREMVHLREERAVVERQPVNRPASPNELDTFREGSMEIRESAEVPVVAKTARVVEEVSVGKQVREHDETVEDTLRRKDVEVERFGSDDRTAMREDRALASESDRERLAREEQQRAGGSRSPLDPDKPR
jgi:uncharacterized protein (TIGR02271 family)